MVLALWPDLAPGPPPPSLVQDPLARKTTGKTVLKVRLPLGLFDSASDPWSRGPC